MKKIIFTLIVTIFLFQWNASACTSAVISGKATKDGRPMLWKNRDTPSLNNKIMIFHDGKYAYVGLVDSHDLTGKSIWLGYNSKGFGIMNTASYNLNYDTIKASGSEGRLMKMALQTCATISDFRKLLDSLPKPAALQSNFGVIDAQGGAAFFEVGHYTITELDANDPTVAPEGYIIHTNYSFSGAYGKGAGYIRYLNTQPVFEKAVRNRVLTPKGILQKATRNLKNSLTGTDLWKFASIPAGHTKMVWFYDFVPRTSTSSACVVEGVKPGQNTEFTTMWTVLGWPLASVTIPVFLNKSNSLPKVLTYDPALKDAPLCHFALALKSKCFTYNWGTSSKYYMNVNPLLNADKTGFLQVLKPLDNQLFYQSDSLIQKWQQKGKIDEKELKLFYDQIDSKILNFYKNYFNLTL